MTSAVATKHELHAQFLTQSVLLRSDSGRFVNRFARMYPRFCVEPAPAYTDAPLDITILTTTHNAWGRPILSIDGTVWPISNPAVFDTFAYDLIFNAIVARIRSHLLLHAGVVAWQDQGILLAADPQYGKTTLTLELVRRDFSFLSDEIAAVHRTDRTIAPFPRTLRVRPETLALVGLPMPARAADLWLGKLHLDIDEIRPNSAGNAVPLRHVVILHDPSTARNVTPDTFGVLVEHIEDETLAALRRLSGVRDIQLTQQHNCSLLVIEAERHAAGIPAIEAVCADAGVLVLDVIRRPEHRPDFAGPVRRESISTSDAALALMRQFQAGHRSAILQDDHNGSAAHLFMELVTCLEQVACWRMSVGSLQNMADEISALVMP